MKLLSYTLAMLLPFLVCCKFSYQCGGTRICSFIIALKERCNHFQARECIRAGKQIMLLGLVALYNSLQLVVGEQTQHITQWTCVFSEEYSISRK